MLANILRKHYSNEFLSFSGLLQALLMDYQITQRPFNFFTPNYDKLDAQKSLYQHCRILEKPFLLALFCAEQTRFFRAQLLPQYQIMLASCSQITEHLRYHSHDSPYDLIYGLASEHNAVYPHEYLIIDLPNEIQRLNMMDPRGKSALSFILRLISGFQKSRDSVNWLATTRSRQLQIFNELCQFIVQRIEIREGRDEPWLEFQFDSPIFGNYLLVKREIFSFNRGVLQSVERRIQLPMILESFNLDHPEGLHNLWGLRDLADLLLSDFRLQVLDA